jgi:hypothetical protein
MTCINHGVPHYVIRNYYNIYPFQVQFFSCYSKTRPLRFGSWLCSLLQVKIPILLGPTEGANPNPPSIGPNRTVVVVKRSGLVSEYWTVDQVQRNSSTECNALSLEPFTAMYVYHLRSSLKVRNHVSHPNKTTNRIRHTDLHLHHSGTVNERYTSFGNE